MLLPGYPSSTRAYVRLIDRLAEQWHTVAIDYPGFGQSDPLPQSPTFDRLAEVTGKTIDALAIKDYAIYMFDFGAPVGFRIALEHDQRVAAIITQNANAYTDGFGPGVAALANWWEDRDAGQPAVDEFVSLPGTQMQWQAGARDPEHIDPAHAFDDQRVLDLPGRADYISAPKRGTTRTTRPATPTGRPGCGNANPPCLRSGANDPFFILRRRPGL
ncbi:alpha/beta fold hydrolase [Mycobacterium kiyosense]|nr:hypothetical protein IWGMT90018_18880 [Mycobacterium kiyosense]